MIDNNLYFEAIVRCLEMSGKVRIRIKGSSMQPILSDGKDEVTLSRSFGGDLKLLDIALFRYRNGYVLHRLISKNDKSLIFQGDNTLYQKELCAYSDVIAKVVDIHRSKPVAISFISRSPIAAYRWACIRRIAKKIWAKMCRL